jgi:hypothetical protein
MKSRSYKKNKNKNKNKSTKKKFGGEVEGFPDLFNSSGQLNLDTNTEESKSNNKYYYAGIAGAVVLIGVLISVKK